MKITIIGAGNGGFAATADRNDGLPPPYYLLPFRRETVSQLQKPVPNKTEETVGWKSFRAATFHTSDLGVRYP